MAARDRTASQRRGLHLTDLIAELRRVVTDPAVPERTAELAAAQLARLAAAGVAGAHPARLVRAGGPVHHGTRAYRATRR